MAQYPKPSGNSGTFNNSNFNNNQSGGLTIAEGLKYFVSYPKTQSPSTITANNFSTTGNLDVAGDSQFGGDVNFLGGVSITGGIVFKDDVEVQGTTTLDDTLLCLTTTTMDGELTVNNNILLNPSLTTPTVAPYLELTNGVAGEYCHLYLDPQVGYDMTLYTNQTTGGGLTVRGANGASYTLNPITISPGIVGAQSLNPVDMNGNGLYGLTNVYADGTGMTFIDSSNSPLLQLTNGGHTSYENINMNTNNISNANTISSTFYNVGLYGTIAVNPSLNPTVLSISNSSTAPSASIYFQMFDSGGAASSPLNMGVNNVNCNVQLNLTNGGDINMGSGSNLLLGSNSITGTGTINGNVYNINTYGTIDQSGTNNGMVITNNAPYVNGAQATIAFNLNGPSGIFNPLKIYNDGINCLVNMNMNNANINGINTITGYNGGNIISGSNINMNNNNIINIGSGSTAFTQPDNTNNTTIATTAFVKSNTPVYTSSSFTLTTANMTLNPSPVPTITTYTSANNVVLFNSSLFTITTTTSGLYTLITLVFGPNPFPNYPPSSLQDSMTMFCTNNNTTYSTQINWSSFTPATLNIFYPQGAPNSSGTVFNIDLATIGAFYS